MENFSIPENPFELNQKTNIFLVVFNLSVKSVMTAFGGVGSEAIFLYSYIFLNNRTGISWAILFPSSHC